MGSVHSEKVYWVAFLMLDNWSSFPAKVVPPLLQIFFEIIFADHLLSVPLWSVSFSPSEISPPLTPVSSSSSSTQISVPSLRKIGFLLWHYVSHFRRPSSFFPQISSSPFSQLLSLRPNMKTFFLVQLGITFSLIHHKDSLLLVNGANSHIKIYQSWTWCYKYIYSFHHVS